MRTGKGETVFSLQRDISKQRLSELSVNDAEDRFNKPVYRPSAATHELEDANSIMMSRKCGWQTNDSKNVMYILKKWIAQL